MTDERLEKIRTALNKSSQVVAWYAHGHEDGTVRGPFCRWFKCSEIPEEYRKNMASVNDDVEYCAIAMNSVPEFLTYIDELRRKLDMLGSKNHTATLTWAEEEINLVKEELNEVLELNKTLLNTLKESLTTLEHALDLGYLGEGFTKRMAEDNVVSIKKALKVEDE